MSVICIDEKLKLFCYLSNEICWQKFVPFVSRTHPNTLYSFIFEKKLLYSQSEEKYTERSSVNCFSDGRRMPHRYLFEKNEAMILLVEIITFVA